MHLLNNDAEITLSAQAILSRAGRELSSNPPNTRYLRDVQKELEDLALRAVDNRLTFLLFFIPLLVNDISYNLIGDIIGIDSTDVTIIRRRVFSHLGKSLLEIANVLNSGDLDQLFVIYLDLVKNYIMEVDQLNTVAKKGGTSTTK